MRALVNQKLLRQGVIVRPIAGYGMPEWLRVTIGTESENAVSSPPWRCRCEQCRHWDRR
jgi:histidinol-phosphate/aromatic aminotransferase/cobyric acid decarboxylase-like protein